MFSDFVKYFWDFALYGSWEGLVVCKILSQDAPTISTPGKPHSENFFFRHFFATCLDDYVPASWTCLFGWLRPRLLDLLVWMNTSPPPGLACLDEYVPASWTCLFGWLCPRLLDLLEKLGIAVCQNILNSSPCLVFVLHYLAIFLWHQWCSSKMSGRSPMFMLFTCSWAVWCDFVLIPSKTLPLFDVLLYT